MTDYDSDENGGGVEEDGNLAQVIPIPLWKQSIQRRTGKDGQPELCPSLINATLVLTHDEAFSGSLAMDQFAGVTKVIRTLPRVEGLEPPPLGPVGKLHISYFMMAMAVINKLSVSQAICEMAVDYAGANRSYNPLTEQLESLRWDGVERINNWLTNYIGVAPTPYSRNVGRWWLISAIARALKPGCQVDHILVLEGKQDAGKSSAFRILGGEFTLPKLPNLRNYDRASHALSGKWIVEIGELDAFRGAGATEIKDFLSLREDHYHPPYGHHHVTRGRTVVFGGTTNDAQYLHDATGARRFWPVKCGTIDREALQRDRLQLFAEAVAAYQGGAEWWPTEDAKADLHAEQEARQQVDAWEPLVIEWLTARDGVTTGEVLEGALKIFPADWSRDNQTRMGHILRRLNYFVKQQREHGVRSRRYYRI